MCVCFYLETFSSFIHSWKTNDLFLTFKMANFLPFFLRIYLLSVQLIAHTTFPHQDFISIYKRCWARLYVCICFVFFYVFLAITSKFSFKIVAFALLKGLFGRFDAIFNRFSLVLDSQKQIGLLFLLSILF